MQIPQNLIDLIDSGLAFTLTVKHADGSTLSYSTKAKTAFLEKKTVKVPGEVEAAFKRFDSMSEGERLTEGVWNNACGMAVAVKGRFAKSFNANPYALKKETAYLGKGKSGRCYLIPRPVIAMHDNQLPKPETPSSRTALNDMAERLARQDPPFWPFPPPPHPSESQHAEQPPTGCPLASQSIASDPGTGPDGSGD